MFYFQGIMWGLACIVLIYDDDVKIPYVKGENYSAPTSAKLAYTTIDKYPSELAIMGAISFCLTLVNIVCIFATAIIVLKVSQTIFCNDVMWSIRYNYSQTTFLSNVLSLWLSFFYFEDGEAGFSDILALIYQSTQCHITKTTIPFMLLRISEAKLFILCFMYDGNLYII
jgi:hypothetical protein